MAGLVLAAGAGRRYGQPKALVDTGSGPWVLRALDVLTGLDPLVVVTGAADPAVRALLPPGVVAVFNPDFGTGMGSSLSAGLCWMRANDAAAVLVMLVDLPDVTPAVVDRVVAAADGRHPRGALVRAMYGGVPGHPVLLGADHYAGVIGSATGDSGAREYLNSHDVTLVECGDIGGGRDVDHPL